MDSSDESEKEARAPVVSEAELKNRAHQWFQQLYQQLTVGCGYVCYNPVCRSCAFFRADQLEGMDNKAISLRCLNEVKRAMLKSPTLRPFFLCQSRDYPKPLSLEQLRGLLSNESLLASRVSEVFSSPPSLATSFFAEKPSAVGTEKLLARGDVAVALEAYRLLKEAGQQKLVVGAMHRCVAIMENRYGRHTEYWPRALLLLLLHDGFLSSSLQNGLLPACYALAKMREPDQASVVRLVAAAYTPEQLRRVVMLFLSAMTARVLERQRVDYIAVGLSVLRKAHEQMAAMKEWAGHPALLKQSDWYCYELSNALDYKMDYFRWRGMFGQRGFSFCRLPFLLPPEYKSRIVGLECDIVQQMHQVQHPLAQLLGMEGVVFEEQLLQIEVSREHLLADSLAQLEGHPSEEYRRKLVVSFRGEEAVDMGGVTKEWFQLLTHDLFREDYGMFKLDAESQCYWFSTDSDSLRDFRLVGMLCGLALFNSVTLDVRFPSVLYKIVKSAIEGGARVPIAPLTLADAEGIDPEYARGLRNLLDYEGDVEEDLGLTFTVAVNRLGRVEEHNIVPGGSKIAVTAANRAEYVERAVTWKFVERVDAQLREFLLGFLTVCQERSPALTILSPEELELLICGEQVLHWDELERGTRYGNGYTAEHPLIRAFWAYFHSLPEEQKKQFLRFATGSDRCPVGGLRNIRLVIERHGATNKLPTASTCFNCFFLPEYPDAEVMKRKVSQAIQYSTGFGFR